VLSLMLGWSAVVVMRVAILRALKAMVTRRMRLRRSITQYKWVLGCSTQLGRSPQQLTTNLYSTDRYMDQVCV